MASSYASGENDAASTQFGITVTLASGMPLLTMSPLNPWQMVKTASTLLSSLVSMYLLTLYLREFSAKVPWSTAASSQNALTSYTTGTPCLLPARSAGAPLRLGEGAGTPARLPAPLAPA